MLVLCVVFVQHKNWETEDFIIQVLHCSHKLLITYVDNIILNLKKNSLKMLKNKCLTNVLREVINSCSISCLISIFLLRLSRIMPKILLVYVLRFILVFLEYILVYIFSVFLISFIPPVVFFCSIDFGFIDMTYFGYELQDCTRLIILDVAMKNYVF